MTSPPREPPILRLNHDLFLYILKMNANMFAYSDALRTTRRTSQVCRRWRNFMLSTPSLWARLIDINSLQYCTTDAWRNEVMRRSGTALLWIAARWLPFSDNSTGLISFFFDVISKHWHRIQKIVAPAIDAKDMHPPPRWNPLYLPAPNLQTFDIAFYDRGSPNKKNVDEEYIGAPLFANDAPMLREFYSRKQCRLDLDAPWLQNLHFLHITNGFTVNEVFAVLKMTPRLRDLQIHQILWETSVAPPLPIISLPHLSRLDLLVDLVIGPILVDHLELPLNCTMKIYLSTDLVPEQQYRRCMQTISRLAKNIFRLYTHQSLLLSISTYELSFEENIWTNKRFAFRISFRFDRQAQERSYMTRMFLEAFTLPELSKVTEFLFVYSTPVDLPTPILASFFACLSSVTVLDMPERTLDYLLNFQDGLSKQADRPIVIFPLVKTVRLDKVLGVTDGGLYKYLLSRIEAGCPISMLDLTWTSADMMPGADFLEEMTGLKVIWRRWDVKDTFEYICGSGNPERLRTYT